MAEKNRLKQRRLYTSRGLLSAFGASDIQLTENCGGVKLDWLVIVSLEDTLQDNVLKTPEVLKEVWAYAACICLRLRDLRRQTNQQHVQHVHIVRTKQAEVHSY